MRLDIPKIGAIIQIGVASDLDLKDGREEGGERRRGGWGEERGVTRDRRLLTSDGKRHRD